MPKKPHAMVLDTYDEDQDLLVFKNTLDSKGTETPQKFKIARTDRDAPKELYFVHIDVPDIASLPSQEERNSNKSSAWRATIYFYWLFSFK